MHPRSSGGGCLYISVTSQRGGKTATRQVQLGRWARKASLSSSFPKLHEEPPSVRFFARPAFPTSLPSLPNSSFPPSLLNRFSGFLALRPSARETQKGPFSRRSSFPRLVQPPLPPKRRGGIWVGAPSPENDTCSI